MWTQRLSGESNQRGKHDHRAPYERDRTRVIHCPAFRRLQRKTQILGTESGDFHRTRLTHSLEVASIGCSIVRHCMQQQTNHVMQNLLPPEDLITVLCLLHDIGHPPFGHGGEVALNYMMRHHGGFEGNAQTLRLVTKLENSYGKYGLDLTRRSLLGILKYPVARHKVLAPEEPSRKQPLNNWRPPKAYFDAESAVVNWILQPFTPQDVDILQTVSIKPQALTHGSSAFYSFDCSIMDIADDIAYGVHDLEDAIHLQLIQRDNLDTQEFAQILQDNELHECLLDTLFHRDINIRKQAIGELVNYFINAITVVSTNEAFEHDLLRYNLILQPNAQALLQALMQCIHQYVIDSKTARTFEYGGQMVILRIFEAFSSNPASLLDTSHRIAFHEAENENASLRVVCDYIANMTDEYAYRIHERLFGFNTRTIFERL